MKELIEVYDCIADYTKEEAIEFFKNEGFYDPNKQYFITLGSYRHPSNGYAEPMWCFYEIKN